MRCVFCVVLYATVAYSTEKANKMSFLGQHSQKLASNRWLKIFEKFNDGVALIKDSEITYAN